MRRRDNNKNDERGSISLYYLKFQRKEALDINRLTDTHCFLKMALVHCLMMIESEANHEMFEADVRHLLFSCNLYCGKSLLYICYLSEDSMLVVIEQSIRLRVPRRDAAWENY